MSDVEPNRDQRWKKQEVGRLQGPAPIDCPVRKQDSQSVFSRSPDGKIISSHNQEALKRTRSGRKGQCQTGEPHYHFSAALFDSLQYQLGPGVGGGKQTHTKKKPKPNKNNKNPHTFQLQLFSTQASLRFLPTVSMSGSSSRSRKTSKQRDWAIQSPKHLTSLIKHSRLRLWRWWSSQLNIWRFCRLLGRCYSQPALIANIWWEQNEWIMRSLKSKAPNDSQLGRKRHAGSCLSSPPVCMGCEKMGVEWYSLSCKGIASPTKHWEIE